MSEYGSYENWNDEYQDDIESQGIPLIRQGQSNSPKVLEGVFGIGDFLMPNGLVAKASYQSISVGCDDLYAHFGPNRGGLLGYFPGPKRPPNTAWLKPGVAQTGFPQVVKEGLYEADGSVWEHGIYWHQLVVAVGKPAVRLEQPICGTLIFKSTQFKRGETFYHHRLKTIMAVIDGKDVSNQCVGMWEVGSELVPGRNNWRWTAPTMTLLGVVGQPGGPSLELAGFAKSRRASFKTGGAWASQPLPAIAAPTPTETPQITASERTTAKPDIRSGRDAWRSDQAVIAPDGYDDDASGPRSLDDAIFD